ncbi:polar tube protein 2 [Ordospora pajunii]|uniref:polar tube protein 2 n=1 Tax=Ordospora pajunii TaxID=3039483 RepID=UPI00295273B8|nr:polar tube protein 2 [Ordospora pajunii]KAH9411305.1 polar tube protein 2 [Ordospora pajunii]
MLLSFAVVAFVGSCIATETAMAKPVTYPAMGTLPLQTQQEIIMQASKKGSQCAIIGANSSECARKLQKEQAEKEIKAQTAATTEYLRTLNAKAESQCIHNTPNGSDVCVEREFMKQAATKDRYTISSYKNVVMLYDNDLPIALAVNDLLKTVPVKKQEKKPDPLSDKKETRKVKLNQFGQVVGLSGPPSKAKDNCVCPKKSDKPGNVTFEMSTRSCADACASKNIMYDAMVQNNSPQDGTESSKPKEEDTSQNATDNNDSGSTEQISEN